MERYQLLRVPGPDEGKTTYLWATEVFSRWPDMPENPNEWVEKAEGLGKTPNLTLGAAPTLRSDPGKSFVPQPSQAWWGRRAMIPGASGPLQGIFAVQSRKRCRMAPRCPSGGRNRHILPSLLIT